MPSPAVVAPLPRILALRRLPALAGLAAAELAVLAEQTRERFFSRGTVLLREGEPVPAIYLVLDGRVHVARGGKVLGHAGPGAAVGGLGLFARDADGIEAVAETEVTALELGAEESNEIFEDHFPILHGVLRETCRQLIRTWQRHPTGISFRLPRLAGVTAPAGELDLVERILILRRAAPFGRSSLNALAELSRAMAEVRFDPDVTLWKEGEPSGSLFLLVDGVVSCSGATDVAFDAGPGTPLGVVESMAEWPRWYTATTATPVTMLHGVVEGMLDVFEDNFEMAMDYLAAIARLQLRLLEQTPGALQVFFGCEGAPETPCPSPALA
jgi:CRP-like cAMP-binding protein